MRSKWFLLIIVFLTFSLQGCETLYGAKDGMKKDIEHWKSGDTPLHKADDWMREHMW
jgi:cytochrome c biogenesis protein ResB